MINSQAVMSYLTTALLVLAALLHVACIRDRTIYLTRAGTTARFLMGWGLVGLATRFGFVIWDRGQLDIPLYVLMFHCSIALGMIVYDLHRFAPFHWMDTRPGSRFEDDDLPQDPRRVNHDRRHDRRCSTTVHTHQ